jgi:geranylgeranyl pyrophosphate synthase
MNDAERSPVEAEISALGRGGFSSNLALDHTEALMHTLGVGPTLARAGVMVQELLSAGGKRVRARLALGAGEALGLRREQVVPWAAACELLHNATLVHDDIEDGDTQRRGRPTTWVQHGVAQAINAGDLLLMLPFRAVEHLDTSDAVRWQLSQTLARAAEAAVRGQSLEMDLLVTGRFGWEDWSAAARGKTGALLGLPVEGAALLAGYTPAAAAQIAAEFAPLGLIFQLMDDVLDLSGNKGRPPGSDIAAGKVSAVVVAHLEMNPEDAVWMKQLLGLHRSHTDPNDVTEAIQRFCQRSGGAADAVRARAARMGQTLRASPTLRTTPDLHAVALELLALLERT